MPWFAEYTTGTKGDVSFDARGEDQEDTGE